MVFRHLLHLRNVERSTNEAGPMLYISQESSPGLMNSLNQRFPIPIPPLSNTHTQIFCMSLLVTHLIQITSSLEESYVHELCSDVYDHYSGSIAPYCLSRGNQLKFTSLQSIYSRICATPLPAASSHTDECDIIPL